MNDIRRFTRTQSHQKCSKCNWENVDGEDLIEEGMPISGLYDLCPKCKARWEYEEVITKQTEMVEMSMITFEKLSKVKLL